MGRADSRREKPRSSPGVISVAMLPKSIGPYRIESRIASGGMGLVYRATAVRDSGEAQAGQAVALKVIHPHLAEEEQYRLRFQRESQIAQSIKSPHVVRVFDHGEVDGRLYQTTELMSQSLLDVIHLEDRLPADRVREIAKDVARGLDAAHRQGVVHRDLSPANILLAQDGTAKVGDYGVARMVGMPTITVAGVFGKPAYASPEHFRGQTDIRSDLYGLGIILYQLLLGELPFEAGTPLEHMRHHDSTPLPALPSDIPPDLAGVIQILTAKQPESRYQTPAELLADLEAPPAPPLRGWRATVAGGRRYLARKRILRLARGRVRTPAAVMLLALGLVVIAVVVAQVSGGDPTTGVVTDGPRDVRTPEPTTVGPEPSTPEPAAVSPGTPAPEPTAIAVGETVIRFIGRTGGSGVRSRSDCETSSGPSGPTIAEGVEVRVEQFGQGRGSGWSYVSASTGSSWVDDQYLIPEPPPPAPTGTPVSAPTPASPTEPPADAPSAPPPAILSLGCVSESPLNVSCDPSASGRVTSWSWFTAFGSPSTGQAAHFATTFTSDGAKVISLKACNDGGCVTQQASVTVCATISAPTILSLGCRETSAP